MSFTEFDNVPNWEEDLKRLGNYCPQVSDLSIDFWRTRNSDPIGACLKVFKNLRSIQFHSHANRLEFQQNTMNIKSEVKSLEFASWKFLGQDCRYLEDVMKIFPNVEEFRMIKCTDPALR